MLQLENLTPFAASMALFPDEEGVDTLFIMAKASFNIGEQWTLCDRQSGPVAADIYWDKPENSSLKYASDYHPCKPSSDIIMNGLACSPGKEPVSRLDVSLRVGKVSKTISVFGDRKWLHGEKTAPQPFHTMPLIYERSFGGVHWIDGEMDSCEQRNPLGCGFAGSRSLSQMDDASLPNLEDPNNLITAHSDTPPPACFGFIAPGWQPRAAYAGSYDKEWQKNRAPYLPEDFDTRFLNMAHPDLIYSGYLQGGEAVSISGMHPNGVLNFNLPEIRLASEINLPGQTHSVPFNLETLILEPNQLQLSMLWRSAFRCDKNALKLGAIKINQTHSVIDGSNIPLPQAGFA